MGSVYILERHIFKDCQSHFAEKLDTFHQIYADSFLLVGVDKPNKKLQDIEATRNPQYSELHYKRIIKGLSVISPLISCKSFVKEKLYVSCSLYYLNNNQDIEDFYMVQQSNRWNDSDLSCYQIWKLYRSNIFDINNHWF